MNNKECLSYIRSLLPSLKGVEQRIGGFIVSNAEDFINMTVAELARLIDISKGNAILSCQKLGFDGFTSLKISVALSMQAQDRFVLGDIAIGGGGDAFSVMTQVFNAILKVLQETVGIIDHDALSHAAELVIHAKRIEFYAIGTSAPIVQDAYYRFMRIGLNTTACVDPHIMSVSASLMQPDCLAIAISHTGRSIQTVAALKEAKEHGANTICITSYADSPIAPKYRSLQYS